MRIDCPHCGSRDLSEFAQRGEAVAPRPQPDDAAGFAEYVYIRDNRAGAMAEHWYHAAGCRHWLVVTRDTRTHEVHAVVSSAEAAL